MTWRTRKQSKAGRRDWSWRFRSQGPPALIEPADDGSGWRIVVDGREVGVVGTKEAAEQLVDKLERADRPK
jgi:hypothetical protein